MTPHEKDTALLDLLAGWLEFVDESREDAEEEYDDFEELYENVTPEVYASFREHYTEDYADTVHDLYDRASELVLGDEEGAPPQLSPAEFIRRHLLPLFEDEG